MKSFSIYSTYLFFLVLIHVSYKYMFNIDNRIEYYFYQKNNFKYKVLKYTTLIINITMMIYIKYILKELIYKYIN